MLAADYPFLDLMWTMLIFFIWILWFWLLFTVFADIFRRHDISGWGKAAWLLFTILLPFLGVFVYVIARGKGMSERDLERAQQSEQQFRSYVQQAAATSGGTTADELAKLADLRDKGVISPQEFEAQKAKILA